MKMAGGKSDMQGIADVELVDLSKVEPYSSLRGNGRSSLRHSTPDVNGCAQALISADGSNTQLVNPAQNGK